jgi:hypothetical protein
MDLAAVGQLVSANWLIVLAVVVGAIANLAPRPHPDELTGWKRTFWLVIDRLCFLTAAKIPGGWKWFFVPSPAPEPPGKLPPLPTPPPTMKDVP